MASSASLPGRYGVETRWGGSEDRPSLERLRELVAELHVRDGEHPDTWLTHDDSGWTIVLDEDGVARLTDPDGAIVSHMTGVTPERALALWVGLASGGPDAVAEEPWITGHLPVDQALRAARASVNAATTLSLQRSFYDSLGSERAQVPCRTAACNRGAIAYSVFCRTHHCEQLWRKTCPFDHSLGGDGSP